MRRLISVVLWILPLACFAGSAFAQDASTVGPIARIESPQVGFATNAGQIAVEVYYSAKLNSKGQASGSVSRVDLMAQGIVVQSFTNRPEIKSGRHTFLLDLTPYRNTAVRLGATAHQANAGANASANLSGSSSVIAIRQDDIPPTIANPTPAPETFVRTSTPQIGVDLTDDGAGVDPSVQVTLDGVDVSAAAHLAGGRLTLAAPPLADGRHAVTVRARDLAQNEAVFTYEFYVDTTPPAIADVRPAPGSFVPTSRPTLSARINDAGSGVAAVHVFVDGAEVPATWSPATGTVTATPAALAEGPHVARLVAEDAVGNAQELLLPFAVDTTAPTIVDTRPAPGSFERTSRPTISARISDAGSGVSAARVFVDGAEIAATWSPATGTVTAIPAALADGPHSARVLGVDAVGNSQDVSFSFLVDTTPPTISNLLPATGTWVTSATPEIAADLSDAGSGISPLLSRLWVDGEDVTASAERSAGRIVYRPAHLAEGPHAVHLATWDQAGNMSEADSQWNVDSVPPLAELLQPAPGGTTANVRPPVEIELTDPAPGSGVAHSSIALTLDGAPVLGTLLGTMLTYAPAADLAPGPHMLGLDQRDVAGNRATQSWTFTVQPAAPPRGPNLAITSPAEGAVVRSWSLTIDIAFSPSSDPIDRSSLRVIFDPLSANPQDLSSFAIDTPTGAHVDPGWSLTLMQGTHDILASLSDISGRRTDVYLRFQVDWSGPHLAITSPADGSVTGTCSPVVRIAFSENGVPINRSSLRVWFYPPGVPPMNLTSLATDVEGGVEVDLSRIPALSDGVYYLSVSLGNTMYFYSYANARFTVDTKPPLLLINASTSGIVGNTDAAVTVSWQDLGGADAATLRVVLDRGTAAERDVTAWMSIYPNSATLDLSGQHALPPGRHTIDAILADVLGHTSTANAQFWIDDAGPSVTLALPSAPAITDTLSPRIEIEYNDAVSGVDLGNVDVWVNGIEFKDFFTFRPDRMVFPGDRAWNGPLLHYSENRILVQIGDYVGNLTRREFVVTAHPKIVLQIPQGGNQIGLIGRLAQESLVIAPFDSQGALVAGVPLKFDVSAGGGDIEDLPWWMYASPPYASPYARNYRLPSTVGNSTVTVSVPEAPDTAAVTASFSAVLPTVKILGVGPGWMSGNWTIGDVVNGGEVTVTAEAEGSRTAVAPVEIVVPEDPQRLWVLNWWPGHFGLILPIPANPMLAAAAASAPSAEMIVRLPEFPHFLYRPLLPPDASGQATFGAPQEVSEAKVAVGPPPSGWLSLSVLRGGQGQTAAPGARLRALTLDFSELEGFINDMDARSANPGTNTYTGTVLTIPGLPPYYIAGGRTVRLEGVQASDTSFAYGVTLGLAVYMKSASEFPSPVSGSGVNDPTPPTGTDPNGGLLTLDLSEGGKNVTGAVGGSGAGYGFTVKVACEPPQARFVREDPLQPNVFYPTPSVYALGPWAYLKEDGSLVDSLPAESTFRVEYKTSELGETVTRSVLSFAPDWHAAGNWLAPYTQDIVLRRIGSTERATWYRTDAIAALDNAYGRSWTLPAEPTAKLASGQVLIDSAVGGVVRFKGSDKDAAVDGFHIYFSEEDAKRNDGTHLLEGHPGPAMTGPGTIRSAKFLVADKQRLFLKLTMLNRPTRFPTNLRAWINVKILSSADPLNELLGVLEETAPGSNVYQLKQVLQVEETTHDYPPEATPDKKTALIVGIPHKNQMVILDKSGDITGTPRGIVFECTLERAKAGGEWQRNYQKVAGGPLSLGEAKDSVQGFLAQLGWVQAIERGDVFELGNADPTKIARPADWIPGAAPADMDGVEFAIFSGHGYATGGRTEGLRFIGDDPNQPVLTQLLLTQIGLSRDVKWLCFDACDIVRNPGPITEMLRNCPHVHAIFGYNQNVSAWVVVGGTFADNLRGRGEHGELTLWRAWKSAVLSQYGQDEVRNNIGAAWGRETATRMWLEAPVFGKNSYHEVYPDPDPGVPWVYRDR